MNSVAHSMIRPDQTEHGIFNQTELFSSHEFSARNGISNMNFFMTSSLNNFCGKIASLSWKESSGGDLLPLSISIEIA